MAIDIRRREFIVMLGSAAAAFPRAARSQAPDIPVVGFLHAGNERPRAVASFQKGLAEGGYVADRNVTFDFRWAGEQFDRLPVKPGSAVWSRAPQLEGTFLRKRLPVCMQLWPHNDRDTVPKLQPQRAS